ncbi:hypothetical protein C8R46DRAFT_1189794 [Mycena filopes]|nr:hypothetical protein C8R46DRAFT_1189794 [Mycena filopes]
MAALVAQCKLGHPPSWTCSSCPGSGELHKRRPVPAHFNARGELIPYKVVVEAHGASVVPDDPKTPGSPDTDLDDDMALGLELVYPDGGAPNAPPPPPPASSSPAPMTPSFAPSTPPTPGHSQSPSAPSPQIPLPRRTVRNPRPAPPRIPLPVYAPSAAAASSSSLVNALRLAQPLPHTKPRKSHYREPEKSAAPAPASPVAAIAMPVKGPALYRKRVNGRPVGTLASPRPYPMHPPPVPPRALPMPMPAPIPVAKAVTTPFQPAIAIPTAPMPPPPPTADWMVGCATAGCKGTVPLAVKGKRCMACVKGSWKERVAKAEKVQEVPKPPPLPQPRVTIKLKLTPKRETVSGEKVESPVEKVDRKGKGKAVQFDVVPTVINPIDEGEGKEKEEGKEKDEGKEKEKVVDEEMPPPADTIPTSKEGEDSADNPWDGAGWDSELSDLTDSSGESEIEEVPRPSFKIRIPARTPTSTPTKSAVATTSALPTPPASVDGTPEIPRLCTIGRCRAPLPPHSVYRWKCCAACRKQYREYQRERHRRLAEGPVAGPASAAPTTTTAAETTLATRVRPEPDSAEAEARRRHAAQKEWQRRENRRALEVAGVPLPERGVAPKRGPVDVVATWNVGVPAPAPTKLRTVEGARKCAGRTCEHILPSKAEYASVICGVCRTKERRVAERAMLKEGKTPEVQQEGAKDDLGLADVKRPGRCMYADCGVLMPDKAEVAGTECEQCLWRKNQRRSAGRPKGKAMPLKAAEKPPEASRKRKRVSPYPAYQSSGDLLADFGTRFAGFIEAQSYYFLLRGGASGSGAQPPAQSMFDFSGEFAVVAPDMDVVARKATVEVRVHAVKDAVARAGGLEFSPTSWVSILGRPGGVVTRFACVHLVDVRSGRGAGAGAAKSKSMQGELEIAVLPDDSHKYFAGEKTIVRFRLVG